MGARSWVLADAESGEYLAGENASERLSMGSTDKIMVALVALRLVESGEADLEDEVTISEDAAACATPLYSNVGEREEDVRGGPDPLGQRRRLRARRAPRGRGRRGGLRGKDEPGGRAPRARGHPFREPNGPRRPRPVLER